MKKTNTAVNTVETVATAKTYVLKNLMLNNTNVNLSKLANATNTNYAAIRAKAKQPIDGQVFDASAINYDAIEDYLTKRCPELDLEKLDWGALNTPTERVTKVLKESKIDFTVGNVYYLRYFKSNWKIVYETATHICLMSADTDSTQPKVMAKTTFIACGVKPEQVAANNENTEEEGA